MTILHGADSAVPQPASYPGKKVWGIYVAGHTPHVWTHNEVQTLSSHGVEGALPVVVPDQVNPWWATHYGSLELTLLVAKARAWGLYVGSPLCLDIEEATAEHILATPGLAARVALRFAGACSSYGYHPWIYGSRRFLDAVGSYIVLRFLAEWPKVTPADPQLPNGYQGWQYAGNPHGGIDLDIFQAGRTYLGTRDLRPVTLKG